jgi:phosphatidylserine/phosphatidylglycerophosphate/cardiolipin synthase-like enzyme
MSGQYRGTLVTGNENSRRLSMKHLIIALVATAAFIGGANARAADFTARPSSYATQQ